MFAGLVMEGAGTGDVPVRCRSEEMKVRCAVCPGREE